MRKDFVLAAGVFACLGAAAAAQAQGSGMIACSSQDALVQYLETEGELVPDGCHTMVVAVMEHEGRQLCALDMTEAAEGFVGETIGGALPTQWWTECAAVRAQLP